MGDYMRKRHLRLIFSREENWRDYNKINYLEKIKDFFECILLSKHEKIVILKYCLIKIYRDYEQSSGIIDIPYFVKADIRMSQIVKDKKIDYYYNRLKKFRDTKIM